MKLLFLNVLAFFFISLMASAQTETKTITVNISNIQTIKGKLIIGLYNSEVSFMEKPFVGKIEEVKETTCHVTFENIPNGNYAISLFHDENDNNKIDTNFLGIPNEAYGCSNNAKGFMSPPKWADAVFTLNTESIIQNINL